MRQLVVKKKAGLEGILDPFASGLLIAATGYATRYLEYFLELSKVYEASLKLGVETDTLDSSGKIIKNSGTSKINGAKNKNRAGKIFRKIDPDSSQIFEH